MADLSPQEVKNMAHAIGIPITNDDLPEVTHRLNAILEHLSTLESMDESQTTALKVKAG